MLQSQGLWLDYQGFNVCQMDVLYGKSLMINFLNKLLKKRTAIVYICRPQTRLAKHVLEIKALSAVSHPSLDYYIITIWLKNKQSLMQKLVSYHWTKYVLLTSCTYIGLQRYNIYYANSIQMYRKSMVMVRSFLTIFKKGSS